MDNYIKLFAFILDTGKEKNSRLLDLLSHWNKMQALIL